MCVCAAVRFSRDDADDLASLIVTIPNVFCGNEEKRIGVVLLSGGRTLLWWSVMGDV
jgi:hypothetical protein